MEFAVTNWIVIANDYISLFIVVFIIFIRNNKTKTKKHKAVSDYDPVRDSEFRREATKN